MSHSSPQKHTSIISFRCPTELKTQMQIFADIRHLSNSDLIRLALEQVMKQHTELGSKLPTVDAESTIAVISRVEHPIKRDVSLHHHIAFLNQEEHDYHGFRFTITRQKYPLQRYFSPKDYGSIAAALDAAIAVRDYVLEQLALRPKEYLKVYEESKNIAPRTRQTVR